jgi:hypothetical protein
MHVAPRKASVKITMKSLAAMGQKTKIAIGFKPKIVIRNVVPASFVRIRIFRIKGFSGFF